MRLFENRGMKKKTQVKQIYFESCLEALTKFKYFPLCVAQCLLEQRCCASPDGAAPGLSLFPHRWQLAELGFRQKFKASVSLICTHEKYQKF